MKRAYKVAAGVAAALGIGLVAVAGWAAASPMGMGPGMMGRGMGPGMMGGGMGHGMMGGMGHGPMAGGANAPMSLMTSEERTALMEKMRNAKTPEERQQLAQATHEQMQKRAKEKGIVLPESRGPGAGFGPHFTPPAATQSH